MIKILFWKFIAWLQRLHNSSAVFFIYSGLPGLNGQKGEKGDASGLSGLDGLPGLPGLPGNDFINKTNQITAMSSQNSTEGNNKTILIWCKET